MFAPQYDPDDEEMPDRVGIITGGASGMNFPSKGTEIDAV